MTLRVALCHLLAPLILALWACSTSNQGSPAADSGNGNGDSTTTDAGGGDAGDALAPADVVALDVSRDGGQQNGDDAIDGSTPDAPNDVDTGIFDAGSSSGDDGADGGDAESCAESIDTYCADAGALGICGATPCIPDWSTAQQPATWCSTGSSPGGSPTLYPQCDGFNVILVACRDTFALLYYDIASSKLVRIEALGARPENTCVAGQPGRVVLPTLMSSSGRPDCWDGSAVALTCASDASGG